jgi:hypothetical protein
MREHGFRTVVRFHKAMVIVIALFLAIYAIDMVEPIDRE